MVPLPITQKDTPAGATDGDRDALRNVTPAVTEVSEGAENRNVVDGRESFGEVDVSLQVDSSVIGRKVGAISLPYKGLDTLRSGFTSEFRRLKFPARQLIADEVPKDKYVGPKDV
ncbi:unnamed protein product [Calicophoron daubneyi]|uniref:Uncharacterized protein n=1 Tax=Calicophoron daubneyi TaxID=300641 RepID=A0AAV2TRX8_CALDB